MEVTWSQNRLKDAPVTEKSDDLTEDDRTYKLANPVIESTEFAYNVSERNHLLFFPLTQTR